MTKSTGIGRGGKRAGAFGRAASVVGEFDIGVAGRVTEAQASWLLKVGGGSISAGIRKACELGMDDSPREPPILKSIAKPKAAYIELTTRSINFRELQRVRDVNEQRRILYNAGQPYKHLI